MSLSASSKIFDLSLKLTDLPNEDVLFTGVLREKLSIPLKWDRPDVKFWEKNGKMTVDGGDPIGTVFQSGYYGKLEERIDALENLKNSLKILKKQK